MRKQGVELSLNVIIIAAIGLLILVILAFLVVNKLGLFGTTQKNNCALNGGVCQLSICGTGQTLLTGTDCPNYCCKVVNPS